MKDLILLFMLLFLLSCKNQNTEEKTIGSVNNSEQDQNDVFGNWEKHKIKNVSFQLPEELKVQSSFSTSNKTMYARDNSSLMLIIYFDTLKPEYLNKNIYQVIDDIDQLGKDIHLEHKQINNDLELISTEKIKIGNVNSIRVTESSFDLLGMNNLILTKSHLCISEPYLFKISIVYSANSSSDEQLMNEVLSSFKFK